MDNVTHTLVGLALARTGLSRLAPGATAVLLLSANAPDIDIVALFWGQFDYFKIHRGYTHSFVALPIMAAICVLVTLPFLRTRRRWIVLWALGCIGVLSHLLLDWTNSYGIRLLLPFSSQWFHLDISSLTDTVVLVVLFLAAIWPWFSGLVSQEIGERPVRGRKSAIAALAFFALFEIARASLHARAQAELEARLYRGENPIAVSALPHATNPLAWTGIVEMPDNFTRLPTNVMENLDPDRGQVFYKPKYDRAIKAALLTEPFRYFVYFARFPVWSEEPITLPAGHGTRVELTDLRFGEPGAGGFHAVSLIDNRGVVLDSDFTFGSGVNLGTAPK